MDSIIDLSDPSKALDLANIRFQLIRLEDTITFHLIERVQFPLNRTIYQPGAIPILEEDGDKEDREKEKVANGVKGEKRTNGEKETNGYSAGASPPLSFMDWYLREQEKLQSLIRRYESPDEYPFFPEALRKPILKPVRYPKILHPNAVNVNAEIKRFYTEQFLPAACPDFGRADRGESGENYGSSATCDIACLQALSRRVHFGKFVAESKFRSDPDKYARLIRAGDRRGIGDAITNAAVEKQVLARLELKAQTYGRDPTDKDADSPSKINAQAVVSMYRDFVIPLTKEVEVEYLMQRLD